MEKNTTLLEKENLEDLLGISISRVELVQDSEETHDEKFANLCHRFAGKEGDIEETITLATRILSRETKAARPTLSKREISLLFSILGTLYYLQEHYEKSIGCFMKALSWYKEDMVPWIELMFAIRAHGEYGIFEDILFNIERMYAEWKRNSGKELTKQSLLGMIERIREG
jgi:tetratricopeptide (TPR) repeat protein